MSRLLKTGPLARSLLTQQQRSASTSQAADPIKKLFLDKIREFGNRGLDEAHKKTLEEDITRLRRVYSVADENKLTQIEPKFPQDQDVSLYDLDATRELRDKIHAGEHQKALAARAAPKSELLASIPEPFADEFHLPTLNKPDEMIIFTNQGPPAPSHLGAPVPDYEYAGGKFTVEKLERDMRVHFGEDMPTISDDKSPERDAVNFPRIPQLLDTPPTRYHVIPESWFKFFYPKTGVSGPYTFAATFGAFLFSKEWLIMEHELLTAFSSIIIFSYAIPKFGPAVRKFIVNSVDEENKGWDKWQKENANILGKAIEAYKADLNGPSVLGELYQARRQELDMQVEAEYRNRLKSVYEDTKKRLDYLVAVAESNRQVHQSNMFNWVISNVHSAFGPKQESEMLDNCILNLKQLASKNANAI